MPRESWRLEGAILLLVSLLLPRPVPASTVLALDAEGLTDLSEVIFIGTVASVRTAEDSHSGLICTLSTVSVEEPIKGDVPPEAVVLVPGGRLGGKVVVVPGSPGFEVGERVLVFGARRGEAFLVTGLYQGKYRVQEGSDGVLHAVQARPAGGVHVVGSQPAPLADSAEEVVDLLQRIEAHLSRAGGTESGRR